MYGYKLIVFQRFSTNTIRDWNAIIFKPLCSNITTRRYVLEADSSKRLFIICGETARVQNVIPAYKETVRGRFTRHRRTVFKTFSRKKIHGQYGFDSLGRWRLINVKCIRFFFFLYWNRRRSAGSPRIQTIMIIRRNEIRFFFLIVITKIRAVVVRQNKLFNTSGVFEIPRQSRFEPVHGHTPTRSDSLNKTRFAKLISHKIHR